LHVGSSASELLGLLAGSLAIHLLSLRPGNAVANTITCALSYIRVTFIQPLYLWLFG
jgi:hypothetical protein